MILFMFCFLLCGFQHRQHICFTSVSNSALIFSFLFNFLILSLVMHSLPLLPSAHLVHSSLGGGHKGSLVIYREIKSHKLAFIPGTGAWK